MSFSRVDGGSAREPLSTYLSLSSAQLSSAQLSSAQLSSAAKVLDQLANPVGRAVQPSLDGVELEIVQPCHDAIQRVRVPEAQGRVCLRGGLGECVFDLGAVRVHETNLTEHENGVNTIFEEKSLVDHRHVEFPEPTGVAKPYQGEAIDPQHLAAGRGQPALAAAVVWAVQGDAGARDAGHARYAGAISPGGAV